VAAPVFSEIANQILPYLDVMPDTAPDARTPNAQGQLASNTTPARIAPAQATADSTVNDESVAVEDSGLPEVARGRAGEVGEVVYAPAAERSLLMPNLRGRSVRDAALICSRLGLELEARGDGRAVSQSPAAGAAVAAGQTVRIEFGRSD
jgi:stage V sporulation protein D (sporulation-specific penicillin-binding protein)